MGQPWKQLLPKIIDTKSFAQGIKLKRPYRPGIDDLLEYQYRMANDNTKGVKTKLEIVAREAGIVFDPELLHDGVEDIKLNKKYWDILKYQVEI